MSKCMVTFSLGELHVHTTHTTPLHFSQHGDSGNGKTKRLIYFSVGLKVMRCFSWN